MYIRVGKEIILYKILSVVSYWYLLKINYWNNQLRLIYYTKYLILKYYQIILANKF